MSISFNGSGLFQVNTSGQPVVDSTVISATVFNALTADLASGLSTCLTKDGQTTATARIVLALGLNSSLTTDTTSGATGSIFTAGGLGVAKAIYCGTTLFMGGVTASQISLRRSGTALLVALGDNSGYADLNASTITSSSAVLYLGGATSGDLKLYKSSTSFYVRLGDGSEYANIVGHDLVMETQTASPGHLRFGFAGAGTAMLSFNASGPTILCKRGDDGAYATFDAGAYKVGGTAGVSFSGASITTLTVVNGIVTGHT